MSRPIVTKHGGILVVRDDLFPGGTKARFLPQLYRSADEVVYASPAEGGAQTALAHTAAKLCKKATIFVAHRKEPHPRALEARRLGATVMQVRPGYLAVVQARAAEYCRRTGATLAPFGVNLPGAVECIAEAAASLGIEPDEVWCAAGSGVLARGLAAAWPRARRHAVRVGRALTPGEVAGATIHDSGQPFGARARSRPPFPSCPHYDAKAWAVCQRGRGPGLVVFWNVTGPAVP